MILSLMASGAAVKVTSGVSENEVSQTTLPVSLSVAMMRGELPKPPAPVMTRLPDSAAPRLRIWRSCLGSMRHTMRPSVAGAGVDLVEDVPGIRDVEETVFGERRCVGELVAGAAAERHRVGELEVLDVVLVDPRERREALAVIGAVVHQPVLRLLVGIEEPFRRHVGRHCGPRQHAARQKCSVERNVASCHRMPPIAIARRFTATALADSLPHLKGGVRRGRMGAIAGHLPRGAEARAAGLPQCSTEPNGLNARGDPGASEPGRPWVSCPCRLPASKAHGRRSRPTIRGLSSRRSDRRCDRPGPWRRSRSDRAP